MFKYAIPHLHFLMTPTLDPYCAESSLGISSTKFSSFFTFASRQMARPTGSFQVKA